MPRQTRQAPGYNVRSKIIVYATFHHYLGPAAWGWLMRHAGNGYPADLYIEYREDAAWEYLEDGQVTERAGEGYARESKAV